MSSYEICGYDYDCADIDARVPVFTCDGKYEPKVIRGWRALCADIRAGDEAVGEYRSLPRTLKNAANYVCSGYGY